MPAIDALVLRHLRDSDRANTVGGIVLALGMERPQIVRALEVLVAKGHVCVSQGLATPPEYRLTAEGVERNLEGG